MRLTNQFVDTVKEPGRYVDSGHVGLMLAVRSKTSKSWVQQIHVGGKRKCFGLGSVKHLSLKEARALALRNQQAARSGSLSLTPNLPTFREAAEKVITLNENDWKSHKTKQNWENVFKKYVYPAIGDKAINKPITADIMDILQPLWSGKKDTARKIRQRTSQVFRWAIAHEYRNDDPAGPALLAAMPRLKAKRKRKHQPALPYAKVQDIVRTVRDSDAYQITKLCFEFVVLTAVRSGEARGATWDEIDLQDKTWLIPETRTKTGIEYRIPLSTQAVKILKKAKGFSLDDTVFPSPRGKHLSDNTLSKLLRDHGYKGKQTVHGFRSCFRDWAADKTNAPREIAEFCLAHIVGEGAELAYRRTDYFKKRRTLMQQWANYLDK